MADDGSEGITLVNQSTLVSDAEIEKIAQACNLQPQNEVAAAWDIKDPLSSRYGAGPWLIGRTIPGDRQVVETIRTLTPSPDMRSSGCRDRRIMECQLWRLS